MGNYKKRNRRRKTRGAGFVGDLFRILFAVSMLAAAIMIAYFVFQKVQGFSLPDLKLITTAAPEPVTIRLSEESKAETKARGNDFQERKEESADNQREETASEGEKHIEDSSLSEGQALTDKSEDADNEYNDSDNRENMETEGNEDEEDRQSVEDRSDSDNAKEIESEEEAEEEVESTEADEEKEEDIDETEETEEETEEKEDEETLERDENNKQTKPEENAPTYEEIEREGSAEEDTYENESGDAGNAFPETSVGIVGEAPTLGSENTALGGPGEEIFVGEGPVMDMLH